MSARKVDRPSGRVTENGMQIGKVERPYEEGGRATRRASYKVIMVGRNVGTAPTMNEAICIALSWDPTDDVDRKVLEKAARKGCKRIEERRVNEVFAGLNPPYSTIVADPPWSYNASVKELRSGGRGGQAEHVYSTMTNAQIAALPVKDLAADEAHLYLWVTVPRLFGERNGNRETGPVEIAEAWGFEFKTMLTWVKPGSGGMGWYFRGQTEHVIFATRGGLGIPADKREPNVFEAKRSGHSQKPASFFDIVERVSPGPRLELFARQPRLGWDAWGHGYEGQV